MVTLGISAYYHDSACALLDDDGNLLAAAQEERFTRKKHDAAFPRKALEYCLRESNLALADVDHVVFYERPYDKFTRILDSYAHLGMRAFDEGVRALSKWVDGKLDHSKVLCSELAQLDSSVDWSQRLLFTEHHVAHGASAFFASPFEDALVLTIDGVGERATTTAALGRGNRLELLKEIEFPHSLGLLYSAFTYYAGFRVNSGEYKLMGLAPYGEPRFVDTIFEHLIDLKDDGSYWIDSSWFDGFSGSSIITPRFEDLFGKPRRSSEVPVGQFHMDLAASIQVVVETVILKMTSALAKETGAKRLCLAGGVALNCVANGKIARSGVFEEIWVQPAAGDAGGALGAALFAHYSHFGNERIVDGTTDAMRGSYVGPQFDDEEIELALKAHGAAYKKLDEEALLETCARVLASDSTLGWFQGRMEFGPRALGCRSILGNAKSRSMQSQLNLKIKKRESFRPFAPAVLEEKASEWFQQKGKSPYMLVVSEVAESKRIELPKTNAAPARGLDQLRQVRSEIPATTHVNHSARVQTVSRETNALFHDLIRRTADRTGCPVLVNTSFNIRGEPVVCSPDDAFRCFMNTDLDHLAMGSFLLSKDDQDPLLALSLAQSFPAD